MFQSTLGYYSEVWVYLRAAEKLRGSQYGSDDIISQMVAIFDRTTKLQFSNENDPAFIKFGTTRDGDVKFNIRNGRLKLMG
jgi:hypothetical protein